MLEPNCGKVVAELAADMLEAMDSEITSLNTNNASFRSALRAVKDSQDWNQVSDPLKNKILGVLSLPI